MVKFDVLVGTANGPPKYGEDKTESMIESRAYNRRQFIMARRSLSLQRRLTFDELVRAILSRSISAWSGHPAIGITDLAELVSEGWVRNEFAERGDGITAGLDRGNRAAPRAGCQE